MDGGRIKNVTRNDDIFVIVNVEELQIEREREKKNDNNMMIERRVPNFNQFFHLLRTCENKILYELIKDENVFYIK